MIGSLGDSATARVGVAVTNDAASAPAPKVFLKEKAATDSIHIETVRTTSFTRLSIMPTRILDRREHEVCEEEGKIHVNWIETSMSTCGSSVPVHRYKISYELLHCLVIN